MDREIKWALIDIGAFLSLIFGTGIFAILAMEGML